MKSHLRAKPGWLVLGLLAVCGLTAAFASSATTAAGSTAGSEKGSLIWVQPLRNHPVHRIMQAGFLSECKKLNWKCEIVGNPSATSFDVPASVALARSAIAAGEFKGAAIYAVEPTLYPFVKEVSKRGLPVVSWHVPVPKGAAPGLTAVTGTDPAKYAKAAALVIGRRINGNGTVALTQGSSNTTENLVSKTFKATMKARYPKVKVLSPQIEGFEPVAAKAKAVSILQGNPKVNAAFSTTGGGPATWAGAADQTRRKLTIISMDYTRQNLDLVKSGKVWGLVAQPLFEEGAKTADLLVAAANGKKIPYQNPLPAPIIIKKDLAKYYAYLKAAGQ